MKVRTWHGWMFALLLVVAGGSSRAQAPGGHGPGGQGPGRPPGMGGGPGGPPPTGGGMGSSTAGTAPNRPATVTSNGVKLGPTGRWWDERSMMQTMNISRDQQRRMDSIFNANKPAIIETYKDWQAQQAKVEALSKDPNADKSQLFAAIDSVNQARAALQKANTQMLLQIREQLTKEQVGKLESLP
ncbi:Spy/CpxP family protein refolding chaperone [Granulicella paludicola]|uniref:Spy/CpxP family protein refolding chaperone n=1 Tax=Granulicella paludicola TaxID=474951 RepID=UPI0021E072DD|nr:periplasmic heavy metal sensor [Granulicella paludicola]